FLADDGAGLPDDFTINRRRGLGMRLINSVLSQLGGKLSTIGGNGTRRGQALEEADKPADI
ncbi:MAG: hypothetical protein J0G97_19830, partial [Rhizobium pusense]|nr:hypothetical protein [Agrobacterium pusense]